MFTFKRFFLESVLRFFCLYMKYINNYLPFLACTATRCPFGGKCVLQEDGTESCQCPSSCPLSYDPICGNDKKTYMNRCALNLVTCLTNGTVTLAHKGKCCKINYLSVRHFFLLVIYTIFSLLFSHGFVFVSLLIY